MGSNMKPTADDRRLHPRHVVCHPLSLETADGLVIACESVDVSVGGIKIRSISRIPLGPAHLVISADGDDSLAVRGEVVEEVLDASTGEITARIVFDSVASAEIERVVALPDRGIEVPSSRRRTFTVLAAPIVAGIVVAGGLYAATRDGDGAEQPRTVRSAATAPAPAPGVERTDDVTRVVVGETAEETSVRTTTRPSPGGEDVRMQLTITPEPDGTTLPVAVRLENRTAETLRFPDGLRATVTATRQGASDAVATLTSDVTSLAPGESVTVEGFLDFGATGEYEVSATTIIG